MPYVNLLNFEKKVIQDVDTNRPTGLYKKHVKYPGRNIKQPTSDDWIRVDIDHQERERVALGTGEYELTGEVSIVVYSPVGKNQTEHHNIVHTYRQIFDGLDVTFTGGYGRFYATEVRTIGEANGYFATEIICPFFIREIVSNITTCVLDGLSFVEQIILATVTDNELPYLTFEVASPGDPYIAVNGCVDPWVELSVRNGQPLVNNGIRAEGVIDWPFDEGDIVEYEWYVQLPTGFTNDASNGNRWYIMGQWHDKPLSGDGGTGNSPPLSFAFVELNGANVLNFDYLGDVTDPNDAFELPFDTWVKIKVKVWWTQQSNGKAEVYVNDVLNQTENGPNMLNALSHYFKFGQYRHPDIATNNTVYYKDLRVNTVGTFTPA